MTSGTKLLWIDIETTGLNPERDSILEVQAYTARLDAPFKLEDPGFHRVMRVHPETLSVELMDSYVRRMHTKSGLLEECARSEFQFRDLEEELIDYLDQGSWESAHLAGSSVRFDADFVRAQMPQLAMRLSYRLFDVRPIIILCESLGMPELKKGETHRARADLDETIVHGRKCAEWILTADKANALLGVD